MDLKNTIQAMQNLGQSVVEQSRKNLKKDKKETSKNTLFNDINYLVKGDNKSVFVEWTFGDAEDYWKFVDQGVRGSGGYKGKGGRGRARAMGSPFKFKSKNLARGVVEKWIKNKPLRIRGAKGRFVEKNKKNIKNAAFLIGRAIAQRGLTRTLFFTKAYNKELDNQEPIILEAFSKDIDNYLDKINI
tara:strand:- start:4258 stop:4818 length:561 start_codon:yes stop_codon:yes gene_type:complete